MPKISQHCVERVKQAADIVQVCQMWGVVLKRSGSGWAGRCPFHEEKSGSFHVRDGKGAKCFGCGWSGDALKFVMEKEGCTFTEAVEKLAGKFGVLLEMEEPIRRAALAQGDSAGAESAPGFQLPPGVDPKAAVRAMKRQAKFEADRAAEQRLEQRLRDAWFSPEKARRVLEWSETVQIRWVNGSISNEEMEALATARCWPVRWVEFLEMEGLISCPELPWGRGESVAFRVDCPTGSGVRPVGYHQRFVVDGRKSWLYVPYRAAEDKRSNAFLATIGAEQDALAECDLAGVPALPFVMGWLTGVRFLVIAEGQWDAVTFAGACGWLAGESSWPEGVCVMGSRGSTGVDTLLAYWGDWLERERPAVLVLADNDAAGMKWDTPEPLDRAVPGSPLKPTFAERLEKRPGLLEDEPEWVGRARRVFVSRVRREGCKDFNDYWKERLKAGRPITPEDMAGWLKHLGFCGPGGGWL